MGFAQFVHDVAYAVQAAFIVGEFIVDYPADFTLGGTSAQGFVVNVLADGGFYKVAAGQKDGTGFIHDEGFIAHDGQVGASGHAASHYGGNLGDAHAAHDGVVAEYASKVFLIRENFILHGQVNPGAVYQVDNGQVVFHGNLLGTQVFLAGDGKPGTGFHGGVVGHNHALPARDKTDACHHAAGGAAPVFGVHVIPCKLSDFNPFGVFIAQVIDAFAAQHFAFFLLFGGCFGPAPLVYDGQFLFDCIPGLFVQVFVFVEFQIGFCHEGSNLRQFAVGTTTGLLVQGNERLVTKIGVHSHKSPKKLF